MRTHMGTVGALMIFFRLLSAQPQTDGEHWKIRGQWHSDDWYTDAYGQNPEPFYRNPQMGPREGPPYPWHAAQFFIWDLAGHDALRPGSSQLGMSIAIDTSSYPATLSMNGYVPVNMSVPGALSPALMPLQGSTANTGGYIEPGTYQIAVAPEMVTGPLSHFVTVVVPVGTNTNTITVTGIQWPDVAVPFPTAYAGISVLAMGNAAQSASGYWTGSDPDGNGNPTTITFAAVPPAGALLPPPDDNFRKFLVHEYPIQVPGAVLAPIISRSSLDLTFTGAAWTVDQWAGYTLSLYYRPSVGPGNQPGVNRKIISNTATVLSMDYSGFLAGDIVVIRAASAHITARTIGDDNFVNASVPGGIDVASQPGRLIWILYGTGANQPPKTVVSATSAGVFTIASDWDITPDATSVWIVTDPTVAYEYLTGAFENDGQNPFSSWSAVVATTPAITAEAQSLLVQVATADKDGNHFPMRYQPFREVYIPPQDAVTGGRVGASF
jgi:hypothetical protein